MFLYFILRIYVVRNKRGFIFSPSRAFWDWYKMYDGFCFVLFCFFVSVSSLLNVYFSYRMNGTLLSGSCCCVFPHDFNSGKDECMQEGFIFQLQLFFPAKIATLIKKLTFCCLKPK